MIPDHQRGHQDADGLVSNGTFVDQVGTMGDSLFFMAMRLWQKKTQLWFHVNPL
jgi:endoglucanase Acf2